MRGAGEMGDMAPFEKKYGLKGSVISAASLITGIGTAVGLEHVPVEGITGSQNSNIEGKIAAAQQELKKKDFVLVNINLLLILGIAFAEAIAIYALVVALIILFVVGGGGG